MAHIEKIAGKRGNTYRITVSSGFDFSGKRIRHRITYRPTPEMTSRQVQKAVQQAAADFERSIEQGYLLDNRFTFSEYASYVLSLKERNRELKVKTLDRYRQYLLRINPAIGHIRLVDLRPMHLNRFYASLSGGDICKSHIHAASAVNFCQLLQSRNLSRMALARAANISATTVSAAVRGEAISLTSAQAISDALEIPVNALFIITDTGSGLSSKTIMGYHRVISAILSHAEKEMLIPYNAAKKASPPKVKKENPNYFQPEVVAQILQALDNAPLKWRTITTLLLVTGCRRGEIMGLKWEKINFETGCVKIDETRLVSKSKGTYTDTTKTEETRCLYLPAETLQLLRQHRALQLKQRASNEDQWQDTGYVFTQENGLPMHPDSITKWLRNFSAAQGLPHINPHAFRHTVASVLLANGTDIVTVSKQLGHANVSTTENFYSHIIEENKVKASACIADVLLRRKT